MAAATCACNCGAPIDARAGRRYVDQRHRQRAYRQRRGQHPWLVVLITDPCAYCGAPAEEIDHIAALAAGGSHRIDNLIPACRECNRAKGSTPFLHFMLDRVRREDILAYAA